MFYSLLLSLLFVLVYPVLFYLTSDSPLRQSTLLERIELVGLVFFLSVLGAGLLSLFLHSIKSIVSQSLVTKAGRMFSYVILFFAFLLVAENWSYSVFGFGLKTTDSIWSKLLFIIVATFLSYQFTPALDYFGRFLTKKNLASSLVVSSLLALYLVVSGVRFVEGAGSEKGFGIITDKLNIVILLSDGVSASEMSVYGSKSETTPFLNSIRSELMVFENAYTNNQNSTGSVISLLTGISPLTSKVVYPPDILVGESARQSLPRILGEYGYRRSLWGVPHYVDADSQNLVGAFDSNIERSDDLTSVSVTGKQFNLSMVAEALNLPSIQGWFLTNASEQYLGVIFDVTFLKEFDNPFAHVTEDESSGSSKKKVRVNDANRLVNILKDIDLAAETKLPFFSFVHFMNTHGSKFNPKIKLFSEGQVETDPWMIDFYKDAILAFDSRVSEVYRELKRTEQLDRTILIITSDHGMSWSNDKRIPLMIRWPNVERAGSYDVNVQLLDVAPTILTALGLEAPSWMEGTGLLEPENIAKNRYILSAGVFGNEVTSGVWVRKKGTELKFTSANKFSAVYCDFFMKSAFPLDLSLSPLPDRSGESGCAERSHDEIEAEAQVLIEEKLNR